MSARHPNIIRTEDQPWAEGPPHGDKFASRYRRLGKSAGSGKLGCSLYEVAPGKRAFPHHYHYVTEEAYYVLSGHGTLRLGDSEYPVEAGDYIACPVGDQHAHQLINTGEEPLRYLCLSSDGDPDIVVYPDSGKVLSFAGWGREDMFRGLFKLDTQVDYFEGE